MSIVLLGAGQLARALSLVSHHSSPCISLPRAYYPLAHDDLLRGPYRVIVLISSSTPQPIPAVAGAEREPELAMAVNCGGVARLAELAKQHNALLVHFSTDYVFDGAGECPWRELDKPAPLNVYGQSKLAGEQAILASGCRHLIIRTSWLHSPWRDNFLKTMLRVAQRRDELHVVGDQVGAPTSAALLADVTIKAIARVLADPALGGLYHVARLALSAGMITPALYLMRRIRSV